MSNFGTKRYHFRHSGFQIISVVKLYEIFKVKNDFYRLQGLIFDLSRTIHSENSDLVFLMSFSKVTFYRLILYKYKIKWYKVISKKHILYRCIKNKNNVSLFP